MKWNLRLAQFLQRLLPFRAAHALMDSEEGANAPNIPTVSRTNQEQDLGEVSAENDFTRRPCSTDRFQDARPHGSKPLSFRCSSESTKGRTRNRRAEPTTAACTSDIKSAHEPCVSSRRQREATPTSVPQQGRSPETKRRRPTHVRKGVPRRRRASRGSAQFQSVVRIV